MIMKTSLYELEDLGFRFYDDKGTAELVLSKEDIGRGVNRVAHLMYIDGTVLLSAIVGNECIGFKLNESATKNDLAGLIKCLKR